MVKFEDNSSYAFFEHVALWTVFEDNTMVKVYMCSKPQMYGPLKRKTLHEYFDGKMRSLIGL